MILKTNQLRKFFQYANLIRPNTLMPITDYIKFEKGTVTKNSINSFVVYKIDCDESFLIEEKVLKAKVLMQSINCFRGHRERLHSNLLMLAMNIMIK